MSEKPITFTDSGGVCCPPDDESESQQKSRARVDRIIQILDNPEETDLGGAMRMVAVEIATTFSSMDYRILGTKAVNDRIKNLRELSKQIQESAEMSNRDILNFDGPKFQFVFREMVVSFRASILKAGIPADTADHILRVFREEFLTREADLRRDTAKVDAASMASSSTSGATPTLPSNEDTHA